MESLAIEYMKLSLPNIDRDHFDLIDIVETKNESSWNEFYETRLILIIEEKKIPPDDSNSRYVHDFKIKQVDDRPSRDKAVTVRIKKRRRKNKITGETRMS